MGKLTMICMNCAITWSSIIICFALLFLAAAGIFLAGPGGTYHYNRYIATDTFIQDDLDSAMPNKTVSIADNCITLNNRAAILILHIDPIAKHAITFQCSTSNLTEKCEAQPGKTCAIILDPLKKNSIVNWDCTVQLHIDEKFSMIIDENESFFEIYCQQEKEGYEFFNHTFNVFILFASMVSSIMACCSITIISVLISNCLHHRKFKKISVEKRHRDNSNFTVMEHDIENEESFNLSKSEYRNLDD